MFISYHQNAEYNHDMMTNKY